MKYLDNLTKKVSKRKLKHIKYLIESSVYIISIVIVIFANIFGSVYIRMIPLLFILGIIGNIVFKRPVITSIFSTVVSICFVKLSGVTNVFENLLFSFSMGAYVCLGEISCHMILIIYNDIKKKRKKLKSTKKYVHSQTLEEFAMSRKKSGKKEEKVNLKKRFSKKNIYSYVFAPLLIIFMFCIQNYLNSNIFSYLKYEKKLNNYLSKNYEKEDLKIVNSYYSFLKDKNFKFIVRDNLTGRMYNFVVYEDESFDIQDGIMISSYLSIEKNVNEKLQNYLKNNEIFKEYEDISIFLRIIDDEDIELVITKEKEKIDENVTLDFSKEVASILSSLENFNNDNSVHQVLIELNEKESKSCLSAYIYLNRYNDVIKLGTYEGFEYINKALSIEFIE